MATILTPIVQPREEWPDADFDFPDDEPIHTSDAESDKWDDEDWDTGLDAGAVANKKVRTVLEGMSARCVAARSQMSSPHALTVKIRPPLPTPLDDEDGEGISTIKVSALPKLSSVKSPAAIDEDFEVDFALPSDLTELSLRPVSLVHRSSKSSMEWGDKDNTSSSQSSDAYSSLGFADNSPPSTYTSASLPESETDDEEADDVLDGIIVPSGLFESGHAAKKLTRLLETKMKTVPREAPVQIRHADSEEDFESGLILDDDVELNPSRLLLKAYLHPKRAVRPPEIRSKSVPPRESTLNRPPSRLKGDRAKSPNYPPVSSANQFRKLPASTSSRPPPARSQASSQALLTTPTPPPSFTLRSQKSHSGLKPASPPSTRRLARKASLPSLPDSFTGGHVPIPNSTTSGAKYEAPTASSRAKTHSQSASRVSGLDYTIPPTRPSTPSSNPVALRLTMPTSSSRLKSRPPLSSVFLSPATNVTSVTRSISPLPSLPQPCSSSSSRHVPIATVKSSSNLPGIPSVRVLKRPKRLKTYGDGTELDGIEDLPLNRDKEGLYRVQPKGYGNRIPGASYSAKPNEDHGSPAPGKGGFRRPPKRELSGDSAEMAPTAKVPKRTSRIEFSPTGAQVEMKRVPTSPSAGQTKRKPTLIRNLGGSAAPKVIGEMRWNPQTLRWEGNDQALREFDSAVSSSARPALITHLTGSSIGSPVGSLASGARIVGNMFFDPTRMCWMSTLPAEEDEPDVFADLADDEDDEWETKGATIRASQQPAGQKTTTDSSNPDISDSMGTRSRSMSESESDRCSRASMVCDVEDGFLEKCRQAEERHRSEIRGWLTTRRGASLEVERSHLYEIRALATRQY